MNKFAVASLLMLSLSACAPRHKASQMAALTPEQMQKNMMEAGEVRAEHGMLKKLAGNWNVEAKMWMDPSAPPEVTKGRANAKLIYGGRYLVLNYKGSFMGKPFEGQGTLGFDNVGGRYFSTWIDSMSTMMMKSEGGAAGDNSIVLASAMTCPMTREHLEGEEVLTIVDKDHYRWEAFQNRDGAKVKAMELTYARVKSRMVEATEGAGSPPSLTLPLPGLQRRSRAC